MARFAFFAATFAFLLVACGGGDTGGGKGGPRAFPVQVEEIKGQRVEYVVSAVGSLSAFEEVLVTSRVAGVVEKVLFREGDKVSQQSVLVEIEPARFQHLFDAAKASYERAGAELKEAKDGLERREKPSGGGIFSKEEVEAWRTKVAVAAANEREKAAHFAQATLDLEHSKPKPAMAGTIQARLVQTGQWVQPGTVIARLLRVEPLLLNFAAPEDEAASLKPGLAARFTVSGAQRTYGARIVHVAAYADRLTRMVQVIAEVDTADAGQLTPGAFVRIIVPVGSRDDAPTVPETSVRPSEKGFLVYVVEDGKAIERVIEIGLRTPDRRIEVRSGLKVGEQVVVRGAEALRDGASIAIISGQKGTPGAQP
ncbi:MAG: efflux RND transporter periplasmic adaptor subunit [Planctomycetes bacterium]|nr:efflux RND transporter periplasmic adaptor subunit [Planctomycetota bacterium]MCW8134792.1 efflux RND transporter periplasmic adaptor subunit [Planctomycetota bacterium]